MSEFLPDPTNPTSGILPGDATSFQSDLTSAVRLFQSAAKNPHFGPNCASPFVFDPVACDLDCRVLRAAP